MTKKAITYARVSSDDRSKEGRNLAEQQRMTREYAQHHGYGLVTEIAEDDRGASGASFELEGLSHILEMAEEGAFDVLVVREIDRLSRDLIKQLTIESMLKSYGIAVEYVIGEYPDTPEGNLNKQIRAVIAEYERLKIAERNKRGRRNIVRRGQIMLHGNKPPFGYRLSEDGKELIPYLPEAEIVQIVFQWYTQGDEHGERLSSRAIAKRLSEMQVPSWSDIRRKDIDRCSKKRGYGEWGGHMVLKMLHNETYKGTWYYAQRKGKTSKWQHNPRQEWISLEVPALVSTEIWERAQSQASDNAFKARRNVKYEYLMRRRMTCKICGYGISAASIRSNSKLYKYYRCNSQANDLVHKCDLPKYRADEVDAAIWQWIRELLTTPDKLEAGLQAYKDDLEQANASVRMELATVGKLLKEHRGKLEKLLDLYLANELSREMLVERKVKLEGIVSRLEARQAELEDKLSARGLSNEELTSILGFARAVSEELNRQEDTFETRRALIEMLNMTAVLSMEDGNKVIEVYCVLGPEKFVHSDDHFSKWGVSQLASTA
ncbi:MAG: recombinase family protein [Anaerolineae bacterium]|nr:recombinase family protein [Anaerolineae bacterium]